MTTLWTFLLAPLLVLPMVLLFRFVGCGLMFDFDDFDTSSPRLPVPEPVPNYRAYILGLPTVGATDHPEIVPDGTAVIGYWRLVDPITASQASDETNAHHGVYRTSTDPDLAPGNFISWPRSLVDTAPELEPRHFNGGFVAIPDNGELHADEFTIEAWIVPNFGAGVEHTLFQAGGTYRRPGESTPGQHGFRVYATKERAWQVDVAGHGAVLPNPPLIPTTVNDTSVRTHLAVIVQKGDGPGMTKVTIALDGRNPPMTFAFPAIYSRPNGAPLLIGVRSENYPDLVNPDLSGSIQSALQEVVLHRKALSMNEIQNHVDINREPRMVA